MDFTCKRCKLDCSTTDEKSYDLGLCIDCQMGKTILGKPQKEEDYKYTCYWCEKPIEMKEWVRMNIIGHEGRDFHKDHVFPYMVEKGLIY